MNEVEKKVLHRFVELLLLNPDADINFLWVQAGGKIAAQQGVQRNMLTCEEDGCNEPAVMFYCETHAP